MPTLLCLSQPRMHQLLFVISISPALLKCPGGSADLASQARPTYLNRGVGEPMPDAQDAKKLTWEQ